jgi:hypothetical protein
MAYTPEQIKLVADMTVMCNERLERAAKAELNGMFYLVTKDGSMVVDRDTENTFRLTVGDANAGHGFTNFLAAKRAANRWNRNLTPEQAKVCIVHAVSHAQYLEHIVDMTNMVLANMSGAQELIDRETTKH